MRPTSDLEVLSIRGLSKRYEIYERPVDRLKQFILPRLKASSSGTQRAYYKEFWALRDVSLAVNRGEAIGILGRNGAGKSTLLQIIAGTLSPTEGVVNVGGKVAALLELGSGFSPDFTGQENVRLNASLLGLSPSQIDATYEQIVAFADIGDFISQPVKTYSTGMMLRLAFAVQTAVEPELLIVDEALAVGDAKFQKKCFDRLDRLRQGGSTILLVTHDAGTVAQFCSRALILEGGRVFAVGEPHRITRQYHRLLFDSDASPQPEMPAPAASCPAEPVQGEPVTVAEGRADDAGATDHRDEPAPSPDEPPSSASGREVRYGDRRAEIAEIGIRDAEGAETRVLEVHSPSEFYFRVRFNDAIDVPVAYGYMISTPKGLEVYGTKAAFFGKSLPPSPVATVYECRLAATVPLAPGAYFLSVSIAYDDGRPEGEFLDYRFDALEFRVVGAPKCFTTSLIDLAASLDHSEWSGILEPSHPGPA